MKVYTRQKILKQVLGVPQGTFVSSTMLTDRGTLKAHILENKVFLELQRVDSDPRGGWDRHGSGGHPAIHQGLHQDGMGPPRGQHQGLQPQHVIDQFWPASTTNRHDVPINEITFGTIHHCRRSPHRPAPGTHGHTNEQKADF